MAGSFTFQNFSHGTSAPDLKTYLEKYHNMPTAAWWEGADQTFEYLKGKLEMRPDKEESSDPIPDTDSNTITAHSARVSALPLVVVLKAENFLSRIAAVNESLHIVMYGTISTKSHIDIFWDIVGGEDAITVYKFRDDDGSCQIMVGDYTFTIYYFQWSELVRRYVQAV